MTFQSMILKFIQQIDHFTIFVTFKAIATPCYAEFVLKKGTNQTSSELCSGYSNHNYSNNTVKKKNISFRFLEGALVLDVGKTENVIT